MHTQEYYSRGPRDQDKKITHIYTHYERDHMRVIAGTARSLPLTTPGGMHTRPTQDRIKETLFNMLQNDIPGCIFVDMFAGSGQMGIEALSRGARHAYFIDNDKTAIKCIMDNVNFTKMDSRSTILKSDAASALLSLHEKSVDVIFMDPPYGEGMEETVLANLPRMPYFNENTIIIVESGLDSDYQYVDKYGLRISRIKQYKANQHVFIMKK